MRKILLSLLVSMATCSMTWAAVGDEATVDGVTYTVQNVKMVSGQNQKTEMAVVSSVASGITELTIPANVTIEGTSYLVTVDRAFSPFKNNTELTSVDLSNITLGYPSSGVFVDFKQLPAQIFPAVRIW